MYRLQRFRGSRLCSNKNHHPAVHDAPNNINVSHNIGLLRPLRANSRNSLRLHDVQLRYCSVFRNFQLCQSRATNIHHNELFAIHPINRSRPSVFPATCSIRLFSKSTAPSSTLQELPVEELKTLNIPDLPDLSVNLSDPFITPWGESNLPPIPIVTSSRVLQQTQSTNQSKPHSVSIKNERARRSPRIVEVTQHLLSMSSSTNHTNLQQKFKHYLANARIDESLLHKLHLSQFEANNMWILPSSLLKDVHSAIMHFSKEENFQGIILPPNNHPEDVPAGGLPFENHEQKLPGPLVCARLLELIGIPNYYSSLAPPSPFSSPQHNSPKIVVHSSQIDQILESCLQTTVALSRSCKTGKHSLIGNDFSSHQNSGTSGINGGGKSAAHLAEEIWRSVWNTEIKYTSREKKVAPVGVHAPMMYPQIMQPLRIGRIGSIGMGHNPVIEYLVSARQRKNNGRENEFDSFGDNPMPGIETHATSSLDKHSAMPLSKTNQRRYDVSVMLFNSVLDAYSKLGSSSSGLRSEIRRDMVQCAERLLLEVAAKKKTFSSLEAGFTEDTSPELAPSTILQSMQPDVISFNTVMRAWSELSTRQSHAHRNNRRSNIVEEEESNSLAIAFAERTEAILEMMYELSEEGRAQQTTTQAMKSAWDKHSRYSNGGGGFSSAHHTSLSPHAGGVIAPDATSYNILLNAWSRNSDEGAALRALDTFRKMVERCNMSCFAREALMAENADTWKETGRDKRSNTIENAFPDARTCVALLNSIHNLPSSMEFEDAFHCVESIHDYMKQWDKQMQWSNQMRVAPRCKDRAKVSRILNVFVYNTLIKTFSKLPANSWEESYRCCQRIDELVSDMESSTSIQPDLITRGMAVYAWTKASDSIIKDDAGTYTQSLRICSDKAGLHADMLLSQMQSTNSAGSKRSDLFGSSVLPAINDAISLYGKALSPSKAEDLFLRAKKYNVYNLQILSAIVDSLAKNSFQDITYAKKAHQYLFEFEQDLMNSNPSSFAPDMKYTSMYNEIIAGFLSSDRKTEGLDHAKNLLSYMIASHESNPRHIARPNTTTFVQVMAALAQRGDHTPQLEELLRIMEELSHRRAKFPKNSKDAKLAANVVPNKVVYNILLKSYARSNDSNALESAAKLLHRMEKDPSIESPDSLSHSTMTTLLSRKDRRESKQVVGSVGDSLIKDGVDSYKEKGEKGLPFNEKEFESSIPSFNAMMNGEFSSLCATFLSF